LHGQDFHSVGALIHAAEFAHGTVGAPDTHGFSTKVWQSTIVTFLGGRPFNIFLHPQKSFDHETWPLL